jgi:hypothetical protein
MTIKEILTNIGKYISGANIRLIYVVNTSVKLAYCRKTDGDLFTENFEFDSCNIGMKHSDYSTLVKNFQYPLNSLIDNIRVLLKNGNILKENPEFKIDRIILTDTLDSKKTNYVIGRNIVVEYSIYSKFYFFSNTQSHSEQFSIDLNNSIKLNQTLQFFILQIIYKYVEGLEYSIVKKLSNIH